MKIRKARLKDAQTIYNIAQSNRLDGMSEDAKESGFLVSEFTLEQYQHYITDYEHFYVFTYKDNVKGFIYAYSKEDTDMSLVVNQQIDQHSGSDFLIIKQICVERESMKMGYATMLYEYLLEKVSVPVYAAIVEVPYNEASVHFHQKMLFKRVMKVTGEDGIRRMIFCHDGRNNSDNINEDLLEKQYEIAVDLYLHEDNLNWSKLNNLFYISGGLVAVVSILASLSSENLLYSILIVSILGILSASLFSVTIHSGVTYMMERKKKVMEIEKLMIRKNATRVVLPSVSSQSMLMTKSPTGQVMIWLPRLILAVWCLAFWVDILMLYASNI